jgi:hypothetical protein
MEKGQENKSQYAELLTVVLSYHIKTRMLDELYAHMLGACSLVVPRILQDDSRVWDQRVALGILNGSVFGNQGSHSISLAYMSSLTAGQIVPVLEMTFSAMNHYTEMILQLKMEQVIALICIQLSTHFTEGRYLLWKRHISGDWHPSSFQHYPRNVSFLFHSPD